MSDEPHNRSRNSGLVSVCIPTYNRYETLEPCLAGLLEQPYDNIEVVISDNTEDSHPHESLRKLISSDRRVRYIRQPHNIGLVPNDTFVRQAATGEFIWVVHDDNELPADYLSVTTQILNADSDISMCGTACDRFFDDRFWYSYEPFSNVGEDLQPRLEELIRRAFSNPWSCEHLYYGVYRRSVIPKAFQYGPWRSIATFFYLCAMGGTIHTDTSLTMRKSTTRADLDKYASANYVNRSSILKAISPSVRAEQRAQLSLRLTRFTLTSRYLPTRMKLSLVKTIVRECLKNEPERGAPPLPNQDGEQDA